MAERFEKVLIDAFANVYEEQYRISSENFVHSEGPSWEIRKFTLKGGKQHGVDLVEIDNGHMTVAVVPTRGMAILEASTEDVSLSWSSPVRQVVHPAYVDEESRGMLGWLEGFNEFVCRCGLAFNGGPGDDEVATNTGDRRTVSLPLHGTVANTPAARLAVTVRLKPPSEIGVVGEVYDTQMYGSSFRLISSVLTVPGAAEFRVEDTVQNLSGLPQEVELLYHCNYGPPLLGEAATFLAPAAFVCPRDGRAAEGIASWDAYGAPQVGFTEQCYFLRNHADEKGWTMVALVDPERKLAGTIRYSVRDLPAFTLWKDTAAEEDGYVTGLEPGTDYPNSRRFEREKGRVVTVPPGGELKTALRFGLVAGTRAVARVTSDIAALSDGKPCAVQERPDPEYCPL